MRTRRLGVVAASLLAAAGALAAWRATHAHGAIALEELYPGAPWIRLVPQLAPLDGVGGVRAEDCGKCHERTYDEWRHSTHAHAFSDLQLQSELGKPSSPRWLCLNCHLPVENQRRELVHALRGGDLYQPIAIANPGFDATLRDEGITCAACHVRRDEHGKSYVVGAVGGTSAPHPVKIDRDALVRRCYDCHDQTYRLTPNLVCWFKTGSELHEGPYANDKECVSCHMPATTRPLVKAEFGTPARAAHLHGFVGGGVPKRFDLYDAQLGLGYRPALDVDYALARDGAAWLVDVTLVNARAGHRAPTGDPERYYLVEAQLVDARDRVLAGQTLRIGQVWQWEPSARQVSDNRVPPRGRTSWRARLDAGGAARLRVTVSHVRLSPDNAAWMKKTAAQADAPFAADIAELERHYPYQTLIFRGETELATGKRTLAAPEELIRRSQLRR